MAKRRRFYTDEKGRKRPITPKTKVRRPRVLIVAKSQIGSSNVSGDAKREVAQKEEPKNVSANAEPIRRPSALIIAKRQIGRSNVSADVKRKAMPPGKRRSKTGKIYWELRKNRSDLKGRI